MRDPLMKHNYWGYAYLMSHAWNCGVRSSVCMGRGTRAVVVLQRQRQHIAALPGRSTPEPQPSRSRYL